MIHFNCPKCGKGFTVSEDCSGKKAKCSGCKSVIVVPFEKDRPLPKIDDHTIPPELQKPEFSDSQTSPATSEEIESVTQANQQEKQEDFTRKFPWFIDIFLYPANITGLAMLIIFVGIPPLISILSQIICFLGLIGLIVNIVIGLYAYWYLCQCVRDSAQGYIRIQYGMGNHPDLRDMFSEMANIVGCLILFFAPACIYMYITKQKNWIFGSLLIFGIAFYPMGVLSSIMHDSAYGLNPFLLIVSIVKTFFQYIGLVLIFWAGVVAVQYLKIYFTEYFSANTYEALKFIIWGLFRFMEIYLLMVAAHLLGRFYCKNSHRLNWEV
jgi:hypothetical protein